MKKPKALRRNILPSLTTKIDMAFKVMIMEHKAEIDAFNKKYRMNDNKTFPVESFRWGVVKARPHRV